MTAAALATSPRYSACVSCRSACTLSSFAPGKEGTRDPYGNRFGGYRAVGVGRTTANRSRAPQLLKMDTAAAADGASSSSRPTLPACVSCVAYDKALAGGQAGGRKWR